MSGYLTIAGEGEGKFTEKMSRFLGFAIPIANPEEAKNIVKDYQNKYHDARHVCWAYMSGEQRTDWQLNDNGEPSGTAGKPILGQINSRGLTDVLVIVVRYFGGIKLGTSGLIQAYRQAASLALDDAGVKEMVSRRILEVAFPYPAADGVMKIVKKGDIIVLEQTFDNTCAMRLAVRSDEEAQISGRLNDLDGVIARSAGQGVATAG